MGRDRLGRSAAQVQEFQQSSMLVIRARTLADLRTSGRAWSTRKTSQSGLRLFDPDATLGGDHRGAGLVQHPMVGGRARPLVRAEAVDHARVVEGVEPSLGTTLRRESDRCERRKRNGTSHQPP